jgi:alpha-L-rhamnosidase
MSELVFQVNDDIKIITNDAFLEKAADLLPVLNETMVAPVHIIDVYLDESKIHGWGKKIIQTGECLPGMTFGKNEKVILDFGNHQVGYLSMNIKPIGSPPDAPLHLKVTFGEMPVEVAEDFNTYKGIISSSWLQEEIIHMDVLPGKLKLDRRYSFRYVKLEVLATSPKYKVSFENVVCQSVSSADMAAIEQLEHSDELLKQIDQVSIKTLADCMQEVFEDGPKRDRRLWLGDLRLQALANYASVKNYDLVKRCLYLFAGTPDDKGRISANLFIKPNVIADDTYFADYSLFFMDTLVDYYIETNDIETLQELWPIAFRQIELALGGLDSNHIYKNNHGFFAFVDWAEGLERETPFQAILIYVMKKAASIAEMVNKKDLAVLVEKIPQLETASKHHLWDNEKKFFVSGPNRQVSYASQVWMILAGVVSKEEGQDLLNRLTSADAIEPSTPYMYHHLIEAYLIVGEERLATEKMKAYWGGMLEDGADTFWELYNPNDKTFSPYGGYLINSYCHAWSCTPPYLIRKYSL